MSGDGEYSLAEAPAVATPPVETTSPPAAAETSVAVAAASAAVQEPPKPLDKAQAKAAKAEEKKRRRRRAQIRVQAPAWAVSLAIHLLMLLGLTVMTLNSDAGKKMIADINSALVVTGDRGEPELTPIYADPGAQRSDTAVGNEHAETAGAPPAVEASEGSAQAPLQPLLRSVRSAA